MCVGVIHAAEEPALLWASPVYATATAEVRRLIYQKRGLAWDRRQAS
jgi:hypothetical protein